ncbi:MAG: diguanylate cyclase [Desulfobacterales bacterium]|nr:diguanylate cyclase [Desulfobacterales bacterium]MBF0398477.1 diguanylate cyclase [Desulfobacterales bacterium]
MDNDDEKYLILIIDDNPKNLQVLGNIVKENGYKIAVAKNGKEAIDFTKKKKPDLILLDIMMPQMDGFETCNIIKADETTKNIPVIFITALSDSQSKVKAFELGGVDYIVKPFMREEVTARIRVHLQLRKAIQRLENMSITDEMTGAYNRRFSYQILSRQIMASKRNSENFVICYIDIDNLKKTNDTYGHKYGDILIKTIVNAFTKAIRSTDYLFRMGGDEFLILFSNCLLSEAENIMIRIHNSLNQEEIQGIPIDFSFGFYQFQPHDEKSIDEIIKIADTSMYKEKKKKKNG